MTIESLKNGNGSAGGENFVNIGFSDGSSLALKLEYADASLLNPDFWRIGREISLEEEAALNFAAGCYRAEKLALRLISRAEQNSHGLSYKLERRGHDTVCVRAVIARFVELELISDERFGELWLRSRLSRQGGKVPGPALLLTSLRSRGLDRESASRALKKVLNADAEWALLLRYVGKNFPSVVNGDYSMKIQLKREGFSADCINRYFEEFF